MSGSSPFILALGNDTRITGWGYYNNTVKAIQSFIIGHTVLDGALTIDRKTGFVYSAWKIKEKSSRGNSIYVFQHDGKSGFTKQVCIVSGAIFSNDLAGIDTTKDSRIILLTTMTPFGAYNNLLTNESFASMTLISIQDLGTVLDNQKFYVLLINFRLKEHRTQHRRHKVTKLILATTLAVDELDSSIYIGVKSVDLPVCSTIYKVTLLPSLTTKSQNFLFDLTAPLAVTPKGQIYLVSYNSTTFQSELRTVDSTFNRTASCKFPDGSDFKRNIIGLHGSSYDRGTIIVAGTNAAGKIFIYRIGNRPGTTVNIIHRKTKLYLTAMPDTSIRLFPKGMPNQVWELSSRIFSIVNLDLKTALTIQPNDYANFVLGYDQSNGHNVRHEAYQNLTKKLGRFRWTIFDNKTILSSFDKRCLAIDRSKLRLSRFPGTYVGYPIITEACYQKSSMLEWNVVSAQPT